MFEQILWLEAIGCFIVLAVRIQKSMAEIQFIQGVPEEIVPQIRLTRSRDGSNGKAIFYFENPKALQTDSADGIPGMFMLDEEGELITRKVKCKFVNGKPEALEATFIIKSVAEWERFMRFMERYAKENGLEFTPS